MFRRKFLIENFDLHNLGHLASVEGIERGRKRRGEGVGIPLFRSPPSVRFILYVLQSNNQG